MSEEPLSQISEQKCEVSSSPRGLVMILRGNTPSFGDPCRRARDFIERALKVDPDILSEMITALDEALGNAVIHGNLELKFLDRYDAEGFRRRLRARQETSPYRERVVQLSVVAGPEAVEFRILDEGPGFTRVREKGDADTGAAKSYGHGILLMEAFMDEVRYNDVGNEVTLVRNLQHD